LSARVSDLRYVAYAVPDLAAEAAFYERDWGLERVAEEDGVLYFAARPAPEHHVVRLRSGTDRKTELIGFAASDRPAVDALHERVYAAQARLIDEMPRELTTPGGGYGFRFFDPDGRALEVSADVEPRAITPVEPTDALPERISHVVLHTPDVKALVAFYERALGFRVTDWLGEVMCLMRCSAAHHRLAILPGPPCLDHVAYDVASIDSMMRGTGRLLKAGVELHWGPGRHKSGNNTFSYFATPNGNTVELTSDLEEVDDDNWSVRVFELTPEIADMWGTGKIQGDRERLPLKPDPGLWQVPA
jgi:catechol 2,3-dioxygenase-like lactoylglutathione lyase family enzyme